MGRYKDAEWYLTSSKALLEKYGDIPPPWIYGPNLHPYSMGWRMGGGETHMMIFNEWFDQNPLGFDDRVKFLQKYPAPARWYKWIIHFLWKVDSYEFEEADCFPYFEKLERLGFNNTSDFTNDFNRDDLD